MTMPTPPTPRPPWIGGGSPRRRASGVLGAVAIAIAAGLAIAGLVVVSFAVIAATQFNNSGNNK